MTSEQKRSYVKNLKKVLSDIEMVSNGHDSNNNALTEQEKERILNILDMKGAQLAINLFSLENKFI